MRALLVVAATCWALTGCDCGGNVGRTRAFIRVEPTAVDFGPHPAGSRTLATVRVLNEGNTPMLVSAIAVEADVRGAFSFTGAPGRVEIGGSLALEVAYTAPAAEGADGATLRISSDADNAPEVTVSLSGRSERGCQPRACAALECDRPDDGCGGMLSCGSCTAPLTCGGGGQTNVCGCTPETDTQLCGRLALDCGAVTATDNCGGPRDAGCGTCTPPRSCGGGGAPNVCGCTPESDATFCARIGSCGQVTAADNCGAARTAACGACTPQLVAQTTLGNGMRDVGVAISVTDAIYVAGRRDPAPQALIARYALPLVDLAAPAWSQRWPPVVSEEAFWGVAARSDGVYACGHSYSRTTDLVGGKEHKGITVKFPLDGGAEYWAVQTPAAPGAFTYGGYEQQLACTAVAEGGVDFVYAGGESQSAFTNIARAHITKVRADGGLQWTRTDSVTNPYSAHYGVTALNGFVYLVGRNDDTGASTPILHQLDPSGVTRWSRRADAGGEFWAVAGEGTSVYAAGRRGPTNLHDFFVEKYGDDAGLAWSRSYDHDGGGDDVLRGVVVIRAHVYGVGFTVAGGKPSAAVLQIDATTGDLVSVTGYASPAATYLYGAATDGTDLYAVGAIGDAGLTDLLLLRFRVP